MKNKYYKRTIIPEAVLGCSKAEGHHPDPFEGEGRPRREGHRTFRPVVWQIHCNCSWGNAGSSGWEGRGRPRRRRTRRNGLCYRNPRPGRRNWPDTRPVSKVWSFSMFLFLLSFLERKKFGFSMLYAQNMVVVLHFKIRAVFSIRFLCVGSCLIALEIAFAFFLL